MTQNRAREYPRNLAASGKGDSPSFEVSVSSQVVSDQGAPSDAELIAAVRGGDGHAYGELFERHRDAAMRLARQLAGPSDADDLVSDAFVKVLRVLSAGGGPDLAFRAYLLTAVRRLHVDKIRRAAKVTPTDQLETFDPGEPFTDPAVQEFENVAASKAFRSLPERWQLVLWHIEVEGQKPAEVAVLLGMSANSVSALAYRAREGLRQAYLQMHMADTAAEECRWVTERLGARVRNGLSRRDTVKVDEHLDECARCSAIYLELSEVNSNLAGILAPLLLGAAASGYLASAGTGSLAAAPWLVKARHFVQGHGAITAGSTAATAVAVSVAIAAITTGASPRDTAADTPGNGNHVAILPSQPGSTTSTTGPGTTSGSNGPGGTTTGPGGTSTGGPPASLGPGGAVPPIGPGVVPGATSTTTGGTVPGSTTGPGQTPQWPGYPPPGHPTPTSPPQSQPPPTKPGPTTTSNTPTKPPPTTPSTPPTSTTQSTPPSTTPTSTSWDLSLSMSSTSLPGKRYRLSYAVGAPAQADGISVTLVQQSAIQLMLTGSSWSCSPGFDKHVSTYTCSTNDSSPSLLQATVKFHPKSTNGSLGASVSAAGNDDPNSGNNSATFAP